MPKDEWGVKRLCPHCTTRFYDLQRNPMTCPNCGAVFDLESLLAKKGSSRSEKKEAVLEDTESDEDAVVLDDDADDDVEIDDELLEDDDDDDSVSLDELADVPSDEDET